MSSSISFEIVRQLRDQIDRLQLSRYAQHIERFVRPSILIQAAAEDYDFDKARALRRRIPDFVGDSIAAYREWERLKRTELPLGASRIGGTPDLPKQIPWPTNRLGQKLHFALQLDCGILPIVPNCPLPRSGWIYVFVENSDREFPLPCSVLHYDCSAQDLCRASDSVEEELAPNADGKRELFILAPVTATSLSFSLPVNSQEDWDLYGRSILECTDRSERLRYSSLGLPPDDGLCTIFGHGGIDGIGPSERARKYGERTGDDWMLLFWIRCYGSIYGTMEWLGDQTLQIYIRRSDLERADFSNCYATTCPF